MIRCQDVTKAYHVADRTVQALRGVTMDIPGPGFFAIMGQSGSGKSTLLHLLAALDRPDSGELSIAGKPVHSMSDKDATRFRRREIGIVFQQFNLIPTLTARENVELPGMLAGENPKWLTERSAELLSDLGVIERSEHRPEALSGGEQQRVAIARALLYSPSVILADEPTGNLDSASAQLLWGLLGRIADQHETTVVMVTHEPAAAAHCRAIYVIRDGRMTSTIQTEGLDAGGVAARYQECLGARRRMGLLGAAVALSSALIAAIACAMAAVNASISLQLESIVGRADISITAPGRSARVPLDLLERVRTWEGVRFLATGALEAEFPLVIDAPLLVQNPQSAGVDPAGGAAPPDASPAFVRSTRTLRVSPLVRAVVDEAGWELRPVQVIAGRLPEAPGEIAIDAFTASRLSVLAEEDLALNGIGVVVVEPERFAQAPVPVPESVDSQREARRINDRQGARLGSTVQVRRLFTEPMDLTIVGITARPPLGGRPRGFMTYQGISRVLGSADRVSEIEILLDDGVDPALVIDAHKHDLGENLLLQTTARVTSGVENNLKSTQLAFILASILALLSASFIILTGLNTDFAERRRELAVLRCIGASKAQLAQSQLLIGLILGAGGAAIGMPVGIGFAALMTRIFDAEVPSGLIVPTSGVLMSTIGTMVAGLLGAAWPAWRTLRMSPLEGLAARATGAPARAILACFIVATILLATHLSLVTFAQAGQGQFLFWSYVFAGLPCLFAGYFLMGVPATWLVTRVASGPASRLLGLPRHVLRRSVQATPFRFGFTAGAMMAGLALMVAIWTEGGAFLRDWLGKMQFPDAFVSGLILPQEAQDKVDSMTEYVENSVALSVIPVETDAFGVRALQRYQTNFIAFDPDRFFAITEIDWVQGDQQTAVARLKEGGAVIVAREFLTAQGMGMGDRFTCRFEGEPHEFEIVGVVTSPGLELISRFFNIGEEFTAQAMHAVFGTRTDAQAKFGVDAIRVISIDLKDDADDAEAIAALRRELFPYGIADAGSGRAMKRDIVEFVTGTLLVFSGIAVMAMLVACFGVANLVVAGIELRRFEFGVLRAVGAQSGLLVRLVLGEALLIALSASVLGTLMGIQAAYAGTRLHALLFGILIHLRPPIGAIAAGWAFVFALTLAAAAPSVRRLARREPRELLAAMRG